MNDDWVRPIAHLTGHLDDKFIIEIWKKVNFD